MDRLFAHSWGKAVFVAVLLLGPLLVAAVAVGMGRYSIPFADVWQTLTGGVIGDDQAVKVLKTMRIPRILLAFLVGGGLAAAGAAFQSLFSNPLATPDTLGVAAGASFGAVLGLYFGLDLIIVQLLALGTGFGAVLITYMVGKKRESGSMVTVVLAGIVVGSLFSALVSLIKYVADTESQLPSITYWLMGSLSSANYPTLLLGAPFILTGIIVLFLLRWRLNVLPLSDDEARATGTNLTLLRFLTAISATMITASAVSMCGQVGWVGLLVPHICRMAIGSNHLRLIPASISMGAIFMVVIDTLARCLTAAEIPVSILTALIGAPFFILLLRRTGGWSL